MMPSSALREKGVAPDRLSLLDRLRVRCDRLLASPSFRRWAAAFPLTRPIARRRARALFDLCAGFVYSQVLLACVRTQLFELLADGPRTLPDLADRLVLPQERARRLLDAAVALHLLARRGEGRYGLGDLGAAMLGNEGIAAMVEHHTMLYADLADPISLLRGELRDTQLSRYWAYARAEVPADLRPERVDAYSALMAASQSFVASEILDVYPLVRHRRLLDVGGGNGAFLSAAAQRAPDLELVLFDLPPVAERARCMFDKAGLAERARAIGGSFFQDPLPTGADIVSLIRVIHDHDDAAAMQILQAVRAALPRDGVLLLAEPMAGTRGAEPVGDAYFGFYLMAMGSGRPRTQAQLRKMLETAGFEAVRAVSTHTPMVTSLLLARPSRVRTRPC